MVRHFHFSPLFLRPRNFVRRPPLHTQPAGGHFFFWAEYLGLIIISFVDAAKIDKDNGQYYQIGIIKYAFLD
jgi:hypothetical protein